MSKQMGRPVEIENRITVPTSLPSGMRDRIKDYGGGNFSAGVRRLALENLFSEQNDTDKSRETANDTKPSRPTGCLNIDGQEVGSEIEDWLVEIGAADDKDAFQKAIGPMRIQYLDAWKFFSYGKRSKS